MLEPAAFLLAACVIAGWVWELFEILPIVCLTGANLGAATRLFRLLSAVSRRALILADLSLRAPMELHPHPAHLSLGLVAQTTHHLAGVQMAQAIGGLDGAKARTVSQRLAMAISQPSATLLMRVGSSSGGC